MKRKYVILPLIFVCFILAGCSAKSDDSTIISAETATVTDQDDLPADISKIEQIFIDEYKSQDGDLQCVQQIVDRLADCGFIAVDSDNKVDMANAEKLRPFLDSLKSGERVNVVVLRVFYSGHCRGFLTQQSGNQPSKSVMLFCNSSLGCRQWLMLIRRAAHKVDNETLLTLFFA